MNAFERAFPLTVVLMMQLLLLALTNLSGSLAHYDVFGYGSLTGLSLPVNLLIGILTVAAVWLIKRLIFDIQKEIEDRLQLENLRNVEELVETMRIQRHDFHHHLQTIHGLLEMDAPGEAREYLTGLFRQVLPVSQAVRTDSPSVSALLHKKIGRGEALGVTVEVEIHTTLKTLSIPPADLNTVLGNLLDNAIEAAAEAPAGEREVKVWLGQDLEGFLFRITNTCLPIAQKLAELFFRPGFTTKPMGRGLGLQAVKKTVERYGGQVGFDYDDRLITFTVHLPTHI